MSVPLPFGPEFLVNSTTPGAQSEPVATGLSGGGFVVAWTDASFSGPDGFGTGIVAQRYTTDGVAIGTEVRVNTTVEADQREPAIAALASGGYVIAWSDDSDTGADTDRGAIRAQSFAADGSRIGAEVLVNSTTTGLQFQPAVAGLDDGRAVVVWSDFSTEGPDASLLSIRARILGPGGAAQGTDFVVNTTIRNSQSSPAVTALEGGRFVVTWEDQSFSADDPRSIGIRAQVFNGDGSRLGSETLVNTIIENEQVMPSVAALAGGGFVIVWTDQSRAAGLDALDDIRGQVFGATGNKIGAEFLINTLVGGGQTEPTVTGLPDGRFAVSWRDEGGATGDFSGSSVVSRIFSAQGVPEDDAVRINTALGGDQERPSIAALADGRIVLAWADDSGTGGDGDTAVRARILDSAETGIVFTGGAGTERATGTRFADRLTGNGGDDTLDGGDGSDTIQGGEGNDLLRGGATGADLRDVIFGGAGNDLIDGGAGNDELRGDEGNDTIEGGAGADTVIGGAGNDVLTGSSFGDALFGGDGFDFINGGFGHDRLNGGAQGDTFFHVGVLGHGSDWIQDFSDAEGDRLQFGGAGTRANFQVNLTETASAGQAGVQEAFVIFKPTGQILWALVDGAAQTSIDIVIGGQTFDLLA